MEEGKKKQKAQVFSLLRQFAEGAIIHSSEFS